jgi:hypothetical protein
LANAPGAEQVPSRSDSIPDWPKAETFLDLSKVVVIGEEDIARCTGIALSNDRGQPCNTFQIGEAANFYFEFEILRDIQVPIGGVVITNRMNINVHGKNSLQINLPAPKGVKRGSRVRFRQRMQMSITPGQYTFAVGFATMSPEVYARIEEMDYRQLEPQLKTIMRVRQAGIFSVTFRTSGLSLPFYGYADLKGDFALAVL